MEGKQAPSGGSPIACRQNSLKTSAAAARAQVVLRAKGCSRVQAGMRTHASEPGYGDRVTRRSRPKSPNPQKVNSPPPLQWRCAAWEACPSCALVLVWVSPLPGFCVGAAAGLKVRLWLAHAKGGGVVPGSSMSWCRRRACATGRPLETPAAIGELACRAPACTLTCEVVRQPCASPHTHTHL